MPLKILHIEDNEDDRFLVRDALTESGLDFELIEALDGREGLEYLRKGPPDWILLDLRMPRMDGFTFLEAYQKGGFIVPVTILTTAYEQGEVQRAYRLGANSYVSKPIKGQDLITTVGAVAHHWAKVAKLPGAPR